MSIFNRTTLGLTLALALSFGASADGIDNGISTGAGSTSLGPLVSNFGGLQFALAQGGLSNPSGVMSGYVLGDNITLSCSGVTFTTAPIVGVVSVTSGAVNQTIVSNPGITSGSVPSGSVACSQASTSGVGTGYQVTATLGVIAANLNIASLTVGGASNNENFLLNFAPGDVASLNVAGPENVFIGPKSGTGFTGNSGFNFAAGVGACGPGGTQVVSSSNVCIGTDTGRNIQGGFSSGGNTLIGAGAGRNAAAGFNTVVGQAAGGVASNTPGNFSGSANSIFGFQAGNALTSGAGNTLIGTKAGDALSTGQLNIILQATNGADNCSNGNESNVFAVCAGGGRILATTGSGTPSTSITTVGGVIVTHGYTVSTLPASPGTGARAHVTDATACTFLGTLTGGGAVYCPVNYNGTAWVGG